MKIHGMICGATHSISSRRWQTHRGAGAAQLALAVSIAAGAICSHAAAATDTWTGGSSTTDNWSDPTNWGGATVTAGDSLVFAGSTRLTPNNDLAAATLFNGLTFNAGSGAFVIGGNGIALGGTVTDNSAAAETFSPAIALNATQNVTVASGGSLALGGAITGAGFGLTCNGPGALILSSASNAYTGGTSISGGGSVQITNATGFGTGAVTVAAGSMANANTTGTVANSFSIAGIGTSTQQGALFNQSHSTTYSGAITLTGNARIGNGGFTSTFTNAITGAGNLEFFSSASGTANFQMNAASSWNGSTTVTAANSGAAILKFGASSVFPSASPLTLNAASTGLAEMDMTGRSETVGGLSSIGNAANDKIINSATGNGTLTLSPTGNVTFAGAILAGPGTGGTSVTKTGAGMQTLAGANTYTGATTVSLGALSVTGSLLSTGTVTLNAATLAGTGSVGNVNLNNAAATVNPGATGAGSAGTLTMAGITTGAGGILQFDLANAAIPSSNDAINVTGTTVFSKATSIAPSAGAQAGTYTVLSDSGGITYTVTPTLTTPTGIRAGTIYSLVTNPTNIQVVVTGGAANLKWSGANPPGDGSTWDVQTTSNWTNTAAAASDVFYNGDLVTLDDSASTFSVALNTAVQPASITFNNSGNDYTISGTGSISGLAVMSVNGTRAVTLTTSNSYAGGTTINNGTLNANAASALGGGPITLNSPGQLNINNAAFGAGTITLNGGAIDNTSGSAITLSTNNSQIWAGNFTFAGSNSLNLGTGAVTLTASPTVTVTNNTLTVGGSIGGSGLGLTKAGAGTLVLSGSNTYSGATNITAGTLVATSSNSLGSLSGAGVTINGGTLDVGGAPIANNVNFSGLPFTIAGTGAGGIGAITNSNSTTTQFNTFRGNSVTLSDDALISGNRIDIGRSAASTLNLNGKTLTLSMSGSQPMFGIETNATVTAGNIVVALGTLDIEQNASVPDTSGTSTITFYTGANAQFFQTTAGDTTRPMVFDGGNTIGSGSATIGTVNSPITLMGNVTLQSVSNGVPSLTANFPLILAGNIGDSGGSFSVTKAGVSTMTLSGNNSWSGGTNVTGGTLTVAAGASIAGANVNVSTGATLNVNGSLAAAATVTTNGTVNFGGNTGAAVLNRPLAALTIGPAAIASVTLSTFPATPAVLQPATLTFSDATATLDLTNNILIAPGTAGTALGLITSGQVFSSSGSADLGYITLDPANFEIRWTLLGDTNLDGTVNVSDLGNLATNFGSTSATWIQGDFDRNGAVNVADLGDLATNFGQSLAAGTATSASAAAVAAVPEPTSLGLLGAGALSLLTRQRRRHARL